MDVLDNCWCMCLVFVHIFSPLGEFEMQALSSFFCIHLFNSFVHFCLPLIFCHFTDFLPVQVDILLFFLECFLPSPNCVSGGGEAFCLSNDQYF